MAATLPSSFPRAVATGRTSIAIMLLMALIQGRVVHAQAAPSREGAEQSEGDASESAGTSGKERAAELTEVAERHYNAGQFEIAAEKYAEAYAAYPAPELLFNLGQCQKHLGNHRRAVFLFERYLRNKPNAPNKALVEEIIAEERAKAKEQPREPDTKSGAPSSVDSDLDAEQADATRAGVFEEPGSGPEPADEPSGTAVYEKWWFWTAVGAVAVAAGGTAVFMATRNDEQDTPTGTLGVVEWR